MLHFQRNGERTERVNMNKKEILNKALSILQEKLDFPDALTFEIEPFTKADRKRPDALFLVEVGHDLLKKRKKFEKFGQEFLSRKLRGRVFIVEVRLSTEPRFLRNSLSYFNDMKKKFPDWYPLIVSRYIGPGGRELCQKEGISYIDTYGNVGIFLKDGLILKEGKESLKSDKRYIKSLFSPKSSCVIRNILENPYKIWKITDLSSTAKVSVGQTYNVIKKLFDEEYLDKGKKGIKFLKPSDLLNQWSSLYVFTEMNRIESFYFSEAVYTRLIRRLASFAEKENYSYGFTLFSGASYVIPYVRTPHVHFYLLADFKKFSKEFGLRPVTSGGNVHLISPYDEGVLNPVQIIEGVKIVGNIQLYIDLVNYPARGKEQAEVLREKVIKF